MVQSDCHPPFAKSREGWGTQQDATVEAQVSGRSPLKPKDGLNGPPASLFAHSPEHVWQRRFYDFNVWSVHKRVEKLRYMHRNPVKRALVASPELWRWSSYRCYALGEAGVVRVNDWTVLKLKIRSRAA